MKKIPIYLVSDYISDALPPEQTYSTNPGHNGVIVGYVSSDHDFSVTYQGVHGAYHQSPDRNDSGFYSVHALIRCSTEQLRGLSWSNA